MRAKLTIEEMHAIASSRGGECLSAEYINCETKLSWRCAKGHEWKTTPNMVKSRHWCPQCARKKKLTIKEMRALAISRGGKCLSMKYVNSYTKLLWRCAVGHEWEAMPNNIKKGAWCPKCSRINLNLKIRAQKKSRHVSLDGAMTG